MARQVKRRPADVSGESVGGAYGIFFNKRAVASVDIPVRHEVSPQNNGWRIDFPEAGRVTVDTDSGKRHLSVEPGDYVLSSGEDLYFALNRVEGGDKPKDEPADRPGKAQEAR